ncbi:unnamed protein product [Prorocentrum cordatum]|uniref:Uncharacterized protein n=1 Tax=Prorocentrum cordatum TaxID=2364126 RepID=A0ABN9XGQ7_9DINO|nr:unnamed protein product [Polarella glacialis]
MAMTTSWQPPNIRVFDFSKAGCGFLPFEETIRPRRGGWAPAGRLGAQGAPLRGGALARAGRRGGRREAGSSARVAKARVEQIVGDAVAAPRAAAGPAGLRVPKASALWWDAAHLEVIGVCALGLPAAPAHRLWSPAEGRPG